MSCIYQEFHTGKCSVYNEGIENPGVNENGLCICSDDKDPGLLCEDYNPGVEEDEDDGDIEDENAEVED